MHYDATGLWARLKDEGRSVAWLARATGYDRTYLHMMRAGMKPITDGFRDKASAALNVDPAFLFVPIDITEVSKDIPQESVAD